MTTHKKLELTWIGKDQRPRLEPRILLEDPKRSCHAKQRVTDKDLFDNWLMGGNLLALKVLEAEIAGQVCCGAYRGVTTAQVAQHWPNITLNKFPKMVKDRYEWSHDDYSMNMASLPMAKKMAEVLPQQNGLFAGDVA